MPFVQATISEDGRLNATIGASGQKSKMNRQESVELFNSAGLPAVLETDMLLWLRCHVPLCVAFESICVAGVRRGGGASWGESMVVARGMQESLTLVQKLGYRLYPSSKVLLTKCPVRLAAFLLWSVSRIPSFRELLGTGADECRALIRVLVQAAHAATPTVSTVHIEAMEPPQ